MFRQMASVFSFLTIIPVGNSDLQTVARHMYLFPIIGVAIGLVIGGAAYGLSFFLEPLIVALLAAAALALITGIHHTDGLADFADGLMARGTRERKWQIMRDPSVGTAGIVSIVLYVAGVVIALSSIRGFDLFVAILSFDTATCTSLTISCVYTLTSEHPLSMMSAFCSPMATAFRVSITEASSAIIPVRNTGIIICVRT